MEILELLILAMRLALKWVLFLSSVGSYLLLLWMLNFVVLLYKRKKDMNVVLKAKMVK